jgi:hypothetical protein
MSRQTAWLAVLFHLTNSSAASACRAAYLPRTLTEPSVPLLPVLPGAQCAALRQVQSQDLIYFKFTADGSQNLAKGLPDIAFRETDLLKTRDIGKLMAALLKQDYRSSEP